MSFLSPEDRAARARATNPQQPSRAERLAYSHAEAQRELPRVLAQIKKSYTSGAGGVNFSFDKSPFRGSRSSLDHRLDYQMMVEELVRLVRAQTGLVCELSESNGPVKSGFRIGF